MIPKLFQVAKNLEKRKIVNTVYSNLRVSDKKLYFDLQNPFSKLLKIEEDTKKLVFVDDIRNLENN